MSLLHLLEPEETVGNLWHRLVGGHTTVASFPEAAVRFEGVAARLRVFFRGLGGEAGVEIRSAAPEVSHHRLTGRRRLGSRSERIACARFDGDHLSLPDTIDVFPDSRLNEDLYYWLAAWSAVGGANADELPRHPVRRDLARIGRAVRISDCVVERFPGLSTIHHRLKAATLAQRPQRRLPETEARIEVTICKALGDAGTLSVEPLDIAALASRSLSPRERGEIVGEAPLDYRTYLPVPLWGEIDPRPRREARNESEAEPGSGKSAGGDGRVRRARRRATDQVNRKGGLFVHRFEKILTWAEHLNLHRDVEDDDEDSARKAADDHDEIGVGKLERKASTRLKIDLDLAPADVDLERLSAKLSYPEWDYRRQAMLADHVRILERQGETAPVGTGWTPGPKMERRIRAVRRQFEALRPRRELLGRQLDGHELDMDALIRSKADMIACGEGSDHIYRQTREQSRDLSVAVLIDASRSTESFVEDRMVLDVEREALVALAEGLDACGDEAAVLSFSSLRRDRVFVSRLKAFGEKAGPHVRARISALKPGFYTRLGAAIRHTSRLLAARPSRKKLLIVLTDGKPNDLDHYEGRYGVEDTRHAIIEARRAGQAVFGITIDSKAQGYFPRIFGARGFAIVGHPSRLTQALPVLYRHLIA